MLVLDLEADANDWAMHPANHRTEPEDIGLTSEKPRSTSSTPQALPVSQKGVTVEHGKCSAVVFSYTRLALYFGDGGQLVSIPFFAFDFSVWELWGALLHGGELAVVPQITTPARPLIDLPVSRRQRHYGSQSNAGEIANFAVL